MMKTIKIITAALTASLYLASCQKVINIKPQSKDAQVIIEAEVTDDASIPQTVRITKSIDLDVSNDFPNVSGALVTISDNAGNSANLNEVSPGIYQSAAIQGIPGRTYYLSVLSDGKTYSSTSIMPSKVSLDTIHIKDDGNKSVVPVFKDPVGVGNYYRVKMEINGKPSKSIFLFNDELIDGDVNDRSLLDLGGTAIETGDLVKIKMMCIDKATNLYFYSLSQNGVGPSASATPANPVTNIQGGSMGYFSAHTLQEKSIIVP